MIKETKVSLNNIDCTFFTHCIRSSSPQCAKEVSFEENPTILPSENPNLKFQTLTLDSHSLLVESKLRAADVRDEGGSVRGLVG